MKILYVTTISNTVNAFLIPHIKMLIKMGHQVDVAFNVNQKVSKEIIKIGCKIHVLPFQRVPLKIDNYKAYKQLKYIIKNEQYDLVHTHTPVASVIARLVCKKMKNVKVFYTAHGFHFFKGAPLKNWIFYYPIELYLSRYTDTLITINKEDYKIAKEKFKAKNVVLINGVGINLQKFKPQTYELKKQIRKTYGYKEDEFILIFAGELSYRKNQSLLIRTVKLISKNISNIKLILVGSGKLENQYKALVKELKIDKNIEFLGYRNDVENLMLMSDICVSSSKQEGLPVNVMEAMATGLPLVVTNCRGNRDLVINNKNGYVVSINEVDKMAEAINKIYLSDDIKKRFSKSNLKIIHKFSLDVVLNDIKKIYSNL